MVSVLNIFFTRLVIAHVFIGIAITLVYSYSKFQKLKDARWIRACWTTTVIKLKIVFFSFQNWKVIISMHDFELVLPCTIFATYTFVNSLLESLSIVCELSVRNLWFETTFVARSKRTASVAKA